MAVTSPATIRETRTVGLNARRYGPRSERIAYVGLLLVLVAIVFGNRWSEISPDWVPQLYLAPVKTFMAALSSWRAEPFLGQPNIHAGLAPTAALISLIRLLGAPAWVAIRVFRILMLVAGGWGAMRLFDRLGGGSSGPVGRVTVAVAYAANPFVIVAGSWMPTLLPYALFPWLLLALDHSIRDPKAWRWPAGFALVFFLMGGVNGGVVPLILVVLGVPAYLAFTRLAGIASLPTALGAVVRCALLSILVSLYWLVPTLFAQGAGASIASTTEHPGDVAATSSYSEVFRLLGFWLMYGYRPNQASYGSTPPVVIATFLVPAAALCSLWLSRARLRILAVILLALSVPVMVGVFPPDGPTPLGRTMRWAFEHVPGAIAFRTTIKAGALPALAFSLLLGLGAQHVARSRPRMAPRAVLVGLLAILIALSVYPALSGQLYPSGWHVPGYWRQAADDLNSGSPESRVLFLPGNYLAVYRWGMREVEDLNESLLDRPTTVRTVLIYGSNGGANLLSAMDIGLQSGSYQKGTVPTVARYLGASDVLLRNDMVWEESGGARPSRLALELYEPGIKLERSYGKPGENVATFPTNDPASPVWSDQQLPPLQRFSVVAPRPIVRAESVSGTVLIDGDNFALGPMVEAGLLTGSPAFRLLGGMRRGELVQAARDNARIVLTDTNRRRIWTFRRTDQDSTATLTPDQGVGRGRESYALFWDQPQKQTVIELRGARAVQASAYGSVFGPVPSSRPALAFDGDKQTAWLVGDYGKAIGQWIRLDLERPTILSHLVLHPASGSSVEIRSVRVEVGSRRINVELPPRGSVQVSFPPTRGSFVRVEITGTRGVGTNPVGFREITIPGALVTEVVRLPRTFFQAARRLRGDEAALVSSRPLDIVLTRQSRDPGTSFDDEERALVRAFALPSPRSFFFSGSAEAGADLPDHSIDQVAGLPSNVVATSSARAYGSIFTRASQALDGDPNTAWVPTGVGDQVDISFPTQRLSHIDVRQGKPGKGSASFVSEATLSLNGGKPFPVTLTPHQTEIRFRSREVRRVTLSVVRIDGLGGEARIGEIALGRVRVPRTDESTPLRGCVRLFNLDGKAVRGYLTGTLGELASGARLPIAPCSAEPIPLSEGDHLLKASPGWLIDTLHLSSASMRLPHSAVPDDPPSRLVVTSSSPARIDVTATRAASPYYVVTGQAFDRRWTATIDGRPLGEPIVVDGYSVGWRINDLRPHRFVISFGPQRWVTLAQIMSAAALLLVVAMLLWPRRRTRIDVDAQDLADWDPVRKEGVIAFSAEGAVTGPVRRVLFSLLAGLVLWFIGGLVGLAAGALAALALAASGRLASFSGRWDGRGFALAAPAALIATIPFILLFTGLPSSSQLTPAFVRSNTLASQVTELALVLAVAGVFADARRTPPSPFDQNIEAIESLSVPVD
jgi:arabinofuranan 3-O-arabinosyltransferase